LPPTTDEVIEIFFRSEADLLNAATKLMSSGPELSAAMKDKTKDIKKFQELIREAACRQLQHQVGEPPSILELERNETVPIYGHWMSIILIAGHNLSIALKIHFDTIDGLEMLEAIASIPKEKQDMQSAIDGVKEYSNLSAGMLKECLGSYNELTGISIPLMTRGFDELLFLARDRRLGIQKFRDIWMLKCSKFQITISSELQIQDWDIINELSELNSDSKQNGEIQFLK
jgi:hypothetical protein